MKSGETTDGLSLPTALIFDVFAAIHIPPNEDEVFPPYTSINTAIERVIEQLYAGYPLPPKPLIKKHVSKSERNAEICARYKVG